MNIHMIPDEFRRHGYQVIDWIADYYERIESSPVLSQVAPGEVRAGLPAHHRRTAPASTAYWPISTR